MIRVGSLFSGSGMLDFAVHQILDGEATWFCEYEPPTSKVPNPKQAAASILAHHWPNVPNLGDITVVDWTTVEPIDVLTAGFPCQDMSAAGKRVGLRPGTRSGLWSHVAYAISQLQPGLVVIENVRGLLSADADCDLEPCPWCLGNDAGRPLRALGCVLGDLAELGYDAQWHGLRAADVGAPHGRFRIFITAWPVADSECGELQRRGVGGVLAGTEGTGAGEGPQRERNRDASCDGSTATRDTNRIDREGRPTTRLQRETGSATGSIANPDSVGQVRSRGTRRGGGGLANHSEPPTYTESIGWREGWSEPEGFVGGLDAPLCGDVTTPDPLGFRCGSTGRHDGIRNEGLVPSIAPNSDRSGLPGIRLHGPVGTTAERDDTETCSERSWIGVDGTDYGPAIHRWERILDRIAPDPTQTGKRGGQQLSAEFCEWLMGWPQGWVTNVPGLSRNDQIKICGNGVVPHQAAAALRHLLSSIPSGARL